MTNLEQIEKTVENLHGEDFRKFALWFEKLQQKRFDQRLEEDAKAGVLDRLAGKALADFRQKRTKPL